MTQYFCPPEYFCFGHDVATGNPVCAHRLDLGHYHVQGMSGSGKTSRTIIPAVDQLSRPYVINGQEERDLVVIVDFAGDHNLFHNAAASARRNGREFWYFINDAGFDSFHFDPGQLMSDSVGSHLRNAQRWLAAWNLYFGLRFGAGYFASQMLGAIATVSKQMPASGIKDLNQTLQHPKLLRRHKDAEQIMTLFGLLAEHPQLSPDPAGRNIDFARALDQPNGATIYFYLPTIEEVLISPLIGGMALYSLIAAAIRRRRCGLQIRRTRLIVDEFQSIVGPSIASVLVQMRHYHITALLANQFREQLTNDDVGLASQVFGGTSVKQYFTITGDDDVKALQSLSEDTTMMLGGNSVHGLSASLSSREIIIRKLTRNKILEVSDTLGDSFLITSGRNGHQEPIHLRQEHRHPDLSHEPLPLRPTPQPLPATHPSATSPERTARQAKLRALLEAKQERERWQLN